MALARQHTIEYLQHEERRSEQQQVDEEGKAGYKKKRAFKEQEKRLHGFDGFLCILPPAFASGQQEVTGRS